MLLTTVSLLFVPPVPEHASRPSLHLVLHVAKPRHLPETASLQNWMMALVAKVVPAPHVALASHRDPLPIQHAHRRSLCPEVSLVAVAGHIVSETVSAKILALHSVECHPLWSCVFSHVLHPGVLHPSVSHLRQCQLQFPSVRLWIIQRTLSLTRHDGVVSHLGAVRSPRHHHQPQHETRPAEIVAICRHPHAVQPRFDSTIS